MTDGLEIVLFSGGRGSAEIAKALAKRTDVNLTLVVNAYDDGLSTGLIRRKFRGMLGPSDIRKNFSHILEVQGYEGQRLAKLLEYRIDSNPNELSSAQHPVVTNLRNFVDNMTQRSSRRASDDISRWLNLALEHLEINDSGENAHLLSDMAIGNLVLAGAFVDSNFQFNTAIELCSDSFDIRHAEILNVTDGENFVLVGTKQDGQYFRDEASIVDKQSGSVIEKIYLLEDYLTEQEELLLEDMAPNEIISFLEAKKRVPKLNPRVREVINSCHLIVYGPGTQHSSLFPSYMTDGLADCIAARSDIEKIFIGNISADHDIQSETISSLLDKVSEYMNTGSSIPRPTVSYVSQCFLTTSKTSTRPWGLETVSSAGSEIGTHIGQWSSDGVKHDGGRVSNGLVSFARKLSGASKNFGYTSISIVIPVLNEVDRLPVVLEKLIIFDWLAYDLVPEFIVVDSGSSDGSSQILGNFPIAKGVHLPIGTGRGEAISQGVKESRGELVVTFPSDDEYDVVAIAEVATLLKNSQVPIVFGSRVGLCADTDERLRSIYGGRNRTYYLSKWGGFTLSILSGVLYKRWISDTLTSVKGFSKEGVKNLSLNGLSADWDMQIIIDASRSELAIAEVPVSFRPRRFDEGKKITSRDGLRAIWVLIKRVWFKT